MADLKQVLVALVLLPLASLCQAADTTQSSRLKADAEVTASGKADGELPAPAKADGELPAPAKTDVESSPPAKAEAESSSPGENGASLYRQYCQACHMADGKGASGAGMYPALATNPKLQAAAYPVVVVMYGKAGMPWFNGLLTPAEIAAIVGYVRTSFGNNYAEPVTTEEVAAMRGPVPTDE